ncbi:hypothetical protein OEA41_005640 [Lepraria neglecta]|uniref:HTH araC/xylS-type domain-containing protein n=1 Tax=Lepraria neglecta TaxID=209136 RepID=A0AAD9Z662_9LECA|nr:hypothetical protein OEA41_005640 [Lepraria neglecta]
MQSQTPRSSISPDRFQSSHSRWLALAHRAPSSHSSFLYGVKSTKIYCRPTCSARLARRANVVFYDTEDQARRDGFRPCKRCKPDNTTFVGEAEEVVTRAIALLRIKKDDLMMKRGLRELAKEVGVTPSYLCRVFKKTMGVTVGAYMKEFEREASEGETESSVQSPSTVGSGVVEVEMGLLTPATTARSLSAPVEGRKGGPAEEDVGKYVEEALDLDFDFNEWFWTEDFSNDSIYG